MSDVSIGNDLITEHIDIWTSTVKTKSSAGRGSSKKIDLYGIKKLRELILELAVRGKLVPQDLSDEPASKLLERIAAEKAQLVIDKKIKKPKALPEISEEEKPFELPEGWEWSRLGVLAEIAPRNPVISDDTDVSFVPMPLISTSYKGFHGSETRKWIEIKKGYTQFSNGDIAIAKITPCFENSKAVIFSNLVNGVGAGTTELHVARPIPNTLNPLFILLYLKAPIFLNVGQTKMTGSAGQKRVPKDFFESNPLPFPPLSEQHRIVAKVDELMALCDQLEQQTESQIEAQQTLVNVLLETLTSSKSHNELMQNWQRLSEHFDTLFTTEQSIDQLKQTILQLAVMGRLVPQDPTDEPANKLLERIAAEKAQLIADKKIKKQKALPPISDDEKPFELPEGWEVCCLSDLLPQFQNGASSRGDKNGREIIVLRLADIKDWQVSFNDTRSILIEDKSIERYSLEKGDVLIIRVNGSADIVGRFITCHQSYDAIYCDHFIRMRFPISCYASSFLSILGASNLIREKISELFVSTAGQKTVNQTHISSLLTVLPPLNEQHRIVAKVDELMAICDQLKTKLNQSQQTQLHLTDAIVEQVV